MGIYRSPLRSIWFDPSRTVARIAHENPGYRLYVLPVLAGFAVLPTAALFSDEGSVLESGLLLSTLLAFGPALEIVQLLVGAYLIRVTGVWLGGKSDVAGIQAAIAWGNVPIVVLALLGIPLMIFSSSYAEISGEPLAANQSAWVSSVGVVLLVLQGVVIAWSMGIFWKGLAVVQGYSLGSAVVNSVVAWTFLAIVVVIGAVAFGYSSSLGWLFFAGANDLVTFSEW